MLGYPERVPNITTELCYPSSPSRSSGGHGAWMAVRRGPRFDERPIPDTPIPESLIDLMTLSSSLAIRWPRTTDESRLALIRQIQQVATELGLETRMQTASFSAEAPGHDDVTGLLVLTPRELDVLRLLAVGHSTHEVAVLLGILPTTVRSHVKSLLSKLGVHSRLEAVSLLLRHDPTSSRLGA
jgi:DNA-binding CsgD family transcriptional regulator